MVYDWRGDHRFRLLLHPTLLSGNPTSGSGQPVPTPVCNGSTTPITSQNGGTVSFLPIFTAACNVEISNIFQAVSGSNTNVGILATGQTSSFTPTTNFEVRGNTSGGIQGRVTNAGTGTAFLSTQAGGTGSTGGVISFLESTGSQGVVGTFTSHPLALITNQNSNSTPSLWITANGSSAGNVGVGTSAPSANFEVNGTAKFGGAVTFGSTVNGAVGNPSGVVVHVDGVKFTQLTDVTSGSSALSPGAYTIYDDCPGGTETVGTDPFNPSGGNIYHLHVISGPCVYTINAPIHLKTGDSWWGAGSGPYQIYSSMTAPVYSGTVWQMGPTFPQAAAPPVVSSFSASFTGSTGSGWNTMDAYFVGVTATTLAGETPLVSGNNSPSSYYNGSTGITPSSGSNFLQVVLPPITGPVAEYCVYVLQGTPGFPSAMDPLGQKCYTSGGTQNISSLTSLPTNPPPDTVTVNTMSGPALYGANTTASMITLGPATNISAMTNTGMRFGNGLIDCNGGTSSIAITNNSAQDPGSGISNLQTVNCLGDAGVEEMGYDGHAGANGSSVLNYFQLNSNCQTQPGGCTGGIDTAPALSGTVSVTMNTNTVSISGPTFPSGWNTMQPYISIDHNLDGCGGNPCQVSSVAVGGGSLTLVSNWTAGTVMSGPYAIANQNIAFPAFPLHVNHVGNMKSVQNVDIGADSCPALTMTDGGCGLVSGVRLDQSIAQNSLTKVQVFAVHCEGNLNGTGGAAYSDCVDDNGVPATIDGVHSYKVTNAVHLEDNAAAGTAPATTATEVRDVVPPALASHYAIKDDVNSITTTAEQAVGTYDIEQPGTLVNPAGNTSLAGGLTLGAPLGPTSGGTGGTALVCDLIEQGNADQRTSTGSFATTCTLPPGSHWFTSTAVVEFYIAGTYSSSTGSPSVTAAIDINGTAVTSATVGPAASQPSLGWIYSGQLSLSSLNTTTGACTISGIGRFDFFAGMSAERSGFASGGIAGSGTSTNCFTQVVSLNLTGFTSMTSMQLNQFIVRVHQ